MEPQDRDAAFPEADVAFDREALALAAGAAGVESHWNVAVVRSRCERLAVAQIRRLGLEAFVPTQTETRQWSDRRKRVERVITPSMVFFNAAQELFVPSPSGGSLRRTAADLERGVRSLQLEVCRTCYVYRLLSMPHERRPADIPDAQIRRFLYMVGLSDERVDIVPELAVGDAVRVVRGPLRGLEGSVSAVRDGRAELGIRVGPLGYAVTGIPAADVEPL